MSFFFCSGNIHPLVPTAENFQKEPHGDQKTPEVRMTQPLARVWGERREGLSLSPGRPFKLLYHRIHAADSVPKSTTSSCLHTRSVAGGSHTHGTSSPRTNPHGTGAAKPRRKVPPSLLRRFVGDSRCWLQQPTTQQPSFHKKKKITPSLGISCFKKLREICELTSQW